MKTKKSVKKAVEKKKVEKDAFGFQKGSKSSKAVALLASGKSTGREARKKFSTLSFSKLLADLRGRGFEVKEDDKGKVSITGQMKLVGQ